MKKTVIIFLGAPGSGKGTQTVDLSEKLGIPVISTGVLFRQEIVKNTEIGRLVKEKMKKGELIDTEVVNKLLEERLQQGDVVNGFILDGYPRKLEQAEYVSDILDRVLTSGGKVFVIYLNISDKTVKERISGRCFCTCGASFHLKFKPPRQSGICDNCGRKLTQRDDDSEESVKKRLTEFHKSNDSVLEFFKDKNYFYSINGERSISEIKEEIAGVVSID